MKNQNAYKRGFTLIELLVVVLIIGILASVALPQYQVAVTKARFAKIRQILNAYKKAADVYVTENDAWPGSFSDLDVTPPAGMTEKTPYVNHCVQNNEFYCCMMTAEDMYQASGITCGLMDYSLAQVYRYKNGEITLKDYACYAKDDNTVATKICSSYNNTKNRNLNLSTPTGHQVGYSNYTMLP